MLEYITLKIVKIVNPFFSGNWNLKNKTGRLHIELSPESLFLNYITYITLYFFQYWIIIGILLLNFITFMLDIIDMIAGRK